MGQSLSRTAASAGRQVARPPVATSGPTPQTASDALDTTNTTSVAARAMPTILLRRPGILNSLRGPRPVPEGMVSIVTPRDGTAVLTCELATSLSARYQAAFSNGMRESQQRSILENIDMPRGVWGALFSALSGTRVTAFKNAGQALSMLALLDYLDPDDSFMGERGNDVMHALAQRALESLPALCARNTKDLGAQVTAYHWALAFGHAQVRDNMAEQLGSNASALPAAVHQLDTEVLATLLREPTFQATSHPAHVRAFVEAWARIHDDAKLSAILDGTFAGSTHTPALVAPTQARPLPYLEHWQRAKRLIANPQRSETHVIADDGPVRVFGTHGMLREIEVPLHRLYDVIVRGETTVFAGHTFIRRGDGHSVVIVQGASRPYIVSNACCTAIDLDDTHLAEGFASGVINLRDLQTKQIVGPGYRGLVGQVTRITLSEQRVCGQTEEDHLRIWDRDSARCVFEMGDVSSYVLHHDMLIVNQLQGRTSVWADWNGTFLQVRAFPSSVFSQALVTDGVRLCAASSLSGDNHVVETLDLATGKRVGSLRIQSKGRIVMFQAMPDGFALGTGYGELWLCTDPSA